MIEKMTEEKNKFDFSITYWIRVKENPGWMKESAEINFPPFTVKNGIMVFFSKIREKLKVYMLHPELGYRKLTANIEKYLRNDTFIALTNSEEETKLYINAELVATNKKSNSPIDLEVGDYVMAEIKNKDIEGIEIQGNIQALVPAKVKKTDSKSSILEFFSLGEKVKVAEIPNHQIKN